MGEKLVIGPINKGLKLDRTPFVIDNDSFPVLRNAFQWRGRIKRKRGTSFLSRLTTFFNSTVATYGSTSSITLDGSGAGNLFSTFSIPAGSNLQLGSVVITAPGPVTYTDNGDGTISPSGTINYITSAVLISALAGITVTVAFNYYTCLPEMGIEDLVLIPTQFPGTIIFDTKKAYNQLTASPYPTYNVSFYKNPASGAYPSYVQKTNATALSWNGQDYQQFWTCNYENALWATNGINIPFSPTNVSMQFKPIVAVTVTAGGPPAIVNIQITSHGLVVGDFLYINEVVTTTGINWQTGYVTAVVNANNVTVEFPTAIITGAGTGGIAQYLTNNADPTKDCIRFYDGDPTGGSASAPTLVPGNGWVNFAPPLSQNPFSINNLPPAIYYLAGARMIVPFKDRLLFIGPVVQSSGGRIVYLQDTIVYSQNGTPYYTLTYENTVSIIDTPTSTGNKNLFSLLVPNNQTAFAPAWFGDSAGFGGWVSAGVASPITTASFNEDVIILGTSNQKLQVVYSGNDIVPFNFYIINSEYGDSSTFSTINMDRGVISKGGRGIIITSQRETQRIDLEIPDEVFEMNLTNNGNERFCAARNFIDEWIYFTYTSNDDSRRFPDQTLMYNYRDNSWAIFRESYTTYGSFKRQTGFIWSTVDISYPTWNDWSEPWNAGDSTLLQQEVLAGNQQGFVITRDEGTGEATSLYISAFAGSLVTSKDHNLEEGDYIVISGCLGEVGSQVNGKIFSVNNITDDTFTLNPLITGTPTYIGGGLITRIYVPFIQSKQFPLAWAVGRKTRIGVQQYLFTGTYESQISLLIFLSQNPDSPYNSPYIIPAFPPTSPNNALIYSNVLYTCPESTNLGLTPANVNLQTPTAVQQSQIWHRMNTSLIGDTVQFGFTLSDAQIRDLQPFGIEYAITAATKANPCVIDCIGAFQAGQLILINNVLGMTELNGNLYQVLSSTATQTTINVNSSAFTTYISGGTATVEAGLNSFAEIEFHGAILDINQSQLLV